MRKDENGINGFRKERLDVSSATNFHSLYYCTFKNFSTVLDFPVVMITSLECICSRACIAMLSALDSSSVISSLIASITVVWESNTFYSGKHLSNINISILGHGKIFTKIGLPVVQSNTGNPIHSKVRIS